MALGYRLVETLQIEIVGWSLLYDSLLGGGGGNKLEEGILSLTKTSYQPSSVTETACWFGGRRRGKRCERWKMARERA
jgi:hypothetical protein